MTVFTVRVGEHNFNYSEIYTSEAAVLADDATIVVDEVQRS